MYTKCPFWLIIACKVPSKKDDKLLRNKKDLYADVTEGGRKQAERTAHLRLYRFAEIDRKREGSDTDTQTGQCTTCAKAKKGI